MDLGQVKRSTETLINDAVERQKAWMARMRERGRQLLKYLAKHSVKTVQTLVAVTPLVNKLQDNEVSRQSYGKKLAYLFSVFSVLAIIAVAVWLVSGRGCQQTLPVAPQQAEMLAEEPMPMADEPVVINVEPVEEPASANTNAVAEPATTNESTTEYTVQRGDCLWNIAAKYSASGHEYQAIAKYNNIANPDLIYPGQKIKINR